MFWQPNFKKIIVDERQFLFESWTIKKYLKYILKRYTFVKKMKTLSLKLDDKIFDEAEKITSKLKLARNRYINEAVSVYNLYNNRRLLKKQLTKESKLTSKDSMNILHEYEKLIDGH